MGLRSLIGGSKAKLPVCKGVLATGHASAVLLTPETLDSPLCKELILWDVALSKKLKHIRLLPHFTADLLWGVHDIDVDHERLLISTCDKYTSPEGFGVRWCPWSRSKQYKLRPTPDLLLHSSKVKWAAYMQSFGLYVSVDTGGDVVVWDSETETPKHAFSIGAKPEDVQIAGSRLVVSNSAMPYHWWDVVDRTGPHPLLDTRPDCTAVLSDCSRLAALYSRGGWVVIWDTDDWSLPPKRVALPEHTRSLIDAQLCPGLEACAGRSGTERRLIVWDLMSQEENAIPIATDGVCAFDVTDSGHLVAAYTESPPEICALH
ncbi:MAG: WD40 repeat domain-containing protein [Planctomycetes bacterium]|nr:WD40 repeat domain-containing protein [Planctomycetota bacterium]